MKTNITEIVFILDRSGSMSGLEEETIGGYNSLIKKQRDLPGEAVVPTVLFDNQYEVLHDRINIKAVKPVTAEEYYVRGNTALLDAMGKTINKIGNAQKQTAPKYRADKVIVVITTDGMENSSREYSLKKVKSMVEHQQNKYGWEFLFLGANMDAISTAGQMGIRADRASNFHADRDGVDVQYECFRGIVECLRKETPLPGNWQEDMETAYQKRKAK